MWILGLKGLKGKDRPLPLRNIRLESQTKRAIYVSATELRKCIYACVNKTLLFTP